MKLTASQLRRIIKEEVSRVLREADDSKPFQLGGRRLQGITQMNPDLDYMGYSARLVLAPGKPGRYHMETEDPENPGVWEPLYAESGTPLLFDANRTLVKQ
jgi:hypothetical protein